MGECVADGKAEETADEEMEDDDEGVYGVLACIADAEEDDAAKSYGCCDADEQEGDVA